MAQKYFTEISNQSMIAQLQQLTSLTFDGDLIGKSERDKLVKAELSQRIKNGWNLITPKGIEYLENLGFINP